MVHLLASFGSTLFRYRDRAAQSAAVVGPYFPECIEAHLLNRFHNSQAIGEGFWLPCSFCNGLLDVNPGKQCPEYRRDYDEPDTGSYKLLH